MPKRIQLSRAKGWRMPPGAVKVDRSTRWGNPFSVRANASGRGFSVIRGAGLVATPFPEREAIELACKCFREKVAPSLPLEELRGKDLACWCPLDGPCHADVLLELANG
jgi:hypothetical protein